MLNRQEFYDIADKIPYRYRHQEFLYSLVRWLRPQVVVEVGTHIGATAVWLARGLQENGRGCLYCIDPFVWPEHRLAPDGHTPRPGSGYAQWLKNISSCQVNSYITILEGRSQEVKWPNKVDMAYIDGNHSHEACLYDYLACLERGATCVAFNDHVTHEGVRRLYNQIRQSLRLDMEAGWDMFEVDFDVGLFVMMKRPILGSTDYPDADPWDKK